MPIMTPFEKAARAENMTPEGNRFSHEKVALVQFTVAGLTEADKFYTWLYYKTKIRPWQFRTVGSGNTRKVVCMIRPRDVVRVKKWVEKNIT